MAPALSLTPSHDKRTWQTMRPSVDAAESRAAGTTCCTTKRSVAGAAVRHWPTRIKRGSAERSRRDVRSNVVEPISLRVDSVPVIEIAVSLFHEESTLPSPSDTRRRPKSRRRCRRRWSRRSTAEDGTLPSLGLTAVAWLTAAAAAAAAAARRSEAALPLPLSLPYLRVLSPMERDDLHDTRSPDKRLRPNSSGGDTRSSSLLVRRLASSLRKKVALSGDAMQTQRSVEPALATLAR